MNTTLIAKPAGVLNKYAAARINDDSVDHEYEDECDRAFMKTFQKSARKKTANAVDLFGDLCNHHRGKFDLVRATLFVLIGKKQTLKSFALWDQGQVRSGVMVQIPSNPSAFYELLETKCSKTYSPAECFNGSPIEDKLAVANSSGALLLAPLVHNGKAHGLISLNSNHRRPFTDPSGVLHSAIEAFACGFDSPAFLTSL